jgi:hypothetical protein
MSPQRAVRWAAFVCSDKRGGETAAVEPMSIKILEKYKK